jgi:hypothetical protein
MRRWIVTAFLVLTAGCSSKSRDPSGGGAAEGPKPAASDAAPAGKSGPADAGAVAVTAQGCDLAALGLGAAHVVPAWTLPAGCKLADGADSEGVVHSDKEFAARFSCPAGSTAGIDFAAQELVMESRQMSPAGVGGEVVDDGKTVTYLDHMRATCPDDPRPMPMSYPVMYLLPAGAERKHAEASCNVGPPRTCR